MESGVTSIFFKNRGFMDVNVLDLHLWPNTKRIGSLSVKYYDLILNCDLVFHPKHKKVWVRMPEKWFTYENKMKYCFWPSKEISDIFQKEVLKIIFDKYSLSEEKVAELHRDACTKRNLRRKNSTLSKEKINFPKKSPG
jgi:hypothetical protein